MMSLKEILGLICGFQQIWLILIATASIVSGGSEPTGPPRFIGALKNITVVQGKDASFTCMVENLGAHRIAWIKADTKHILAVDNNVINNPRLMINKNDHVTWTLLIKNVQRSDRGFYMSAHLEVVIPPDFISEETSAGDIMIPEGSTAKLICRARGFPKPTITFRKEDGSSIIIREGVGGKKKVKIYEGEVLTLSKITRSEMGAYMCIASNGYPPSISKRVLVSVHCHLAELEDFFEFVKNFFLFSVFSEVHPLIQTPNQLFAVGKNFDVTLECVAEASPKAINYWTRESGEMIIANEKYNMTEEQVSSYGVRMRLHIRNLGARDFTGYKCISQNSMGHTEGTIHIHEIKYQGGQGSSQERTRGALVEDEFDDENSDESDESDENDDLDDLDDEDLDEKELILRKNRRLDRKQLKKNRYPAINDNSYAPIDKSFNLANSNSHCKISLALALTLTLTLIYYFNPASTRLIL